YIYMCIFYGGFDGNGGEFLENISSCVGVAFLRGSLGDKTHFCETPVRSLVKLQNRPILMV
ncbi:unnamed protein product, partial [Citrullus colocynthis]